MEESNHVRSVQDTMLFKRSFVDSKTNTLDASIESMFSVLVEMQALHAQILEAMRDEVEHSWPFVGRCGAMLMEHLPKLLVCDFRVFPLFILCV
jgi:hypothetical protein